MEPSGYCPWCMGAMPEGESVCPSCGRDIRTYEVLSSQLPPGTVLHDRFLLGRVLGQGGFGITYIGLDLILRRRVAVKEYFPPTAGRAADGTVTTYASDDSLERGRDAFLDEARAMSSASGLDDAIADARDVFAEHGTAYLVMDYVEGVTLGKWAASQPDRRVPSASLLPLLRPVAEALGRLHGAGVVHRDVSPDNIMVDREGRARLIDFGLARAFDATVLTTAMNPAFAPVEQWTGSGQGPWTDVYAFSATVYACLTGSVPPSSPQRLSVDGLVPPREAGADISEGQEAALLRGLAVQPHDRTQTMAELMGGLFASVGADSDESDGQAARTGDGKAVTGTVGIRTVDATKDGGGAGVTGTDGGGIGGGDHGPSVSRRALVGGAALLAAAGAAYLFISNGTPKTGDSMEGAAATGDDATLGDGDGAVTDDDATYTDGSEADAGEAEGDEGLSYDPWTDIAAVVCGSQHTVGLTIDNTCVACGDDEYGQCDVDEWTDVAVVACGDDYTVAVRDDGTCVACGNGDYGACDVDGWSDVGYVACGVTCTIGVLSDGTCVACGEDSSGQCDVGEWSDVTSVACGWWHTVAVLADGTCVACGQDDRGQCDVGEWTDVVAVACGSDFTVGLRSDGTCVACGNDEYGQCDVDAWTDVVGISCGITHTVAVLADGTCVACGNDENGETEVFDWSGIVDVGCGWWHTIGVESDGTCVACGSDSNGQCEV